MHNQAIAWGAGAGGSSHGAALAGYQVHAAADIDEWARETHRVNMPETKVFDFDLLRISELNSGTIGLARDWIRRCGVKDPENWDGMHVFTGSCKGFSKSGTMMLDHPDNKLVLAIPTILAATPRAKMVFENVPCFLSDEFIPLHEMLFDAVAELGRGRLSVPFLKKYLLLASDFGVPQRRRRLIFPIMREGELYPPPPRPTCIRERDLAETIGQNSGWTDNDPTYFELTDLEKRLIRSVPANGNWKDAVERDDFAHQYAEDHGWFDVTKPTGALKVLGWDRPGTTVVASTDFHISRVEPLHPDRRRFTLGEKGRQQGFPSEWVMLGSPSVRCRLIGNAVPPQMMAAAIRAYFPL